MPWYKKYILPNDNYVEDTIFCNDRSMRNADTNSWNPNGGGVSTYVYFGETSSLNCANVTDKFSVSNNKAKLTYKVGLITLPEMNLNDYAIVHKTGQSYWLASPYDCAVFGFVAGRSISSGGYIFEESIDRSIGVRPAISLKAGTKYSAGDGSMANPYYVGDTYSITNNNNLFTIIKKSPPGKEVTISANDYIVTSFKLNGTLVNGNTFMMPEEDVEITDIQYIDANYSITNTDSEITVPNTGRYGSTITLESNAYLVTSFKLNGTLVSGNSFVMPAEAVVITEITKTPQITIESNHNPYPNNEDNVVYYENTFENATSLTVELTYQTESISYDWIYLYDDENSSTPVNNKKYGGSTKQTETININSDYIKIVFRTDGDTNNYYGFKAVITPNFD